jgi:hypothetical protein
MTPRIFELAKSGVSSLRCRAQVLVKMVVSAKSLRLKNLLDLPLLRFLHVGPYIHIDSNGISIFYWCFMLFKEMGILFNPVVEPCQILIAMTTVCENTFGSPKRMLLYKEVSLFNHDCYSNARVTGNSVFAHKVIKKGEQVVISYHNADPSKQPDEYYKRAVILMVLYGFRCKCVSCRSNVALQKFLDNYEKDQKVIDHDFRLS